MNQTKKLFKKFFAASLIVGLIAGIFRFTIYTQQTTKSEKTEKAALVLKTVETKIAQPDKHERAPASIQPQTEIQLVESIEIPTQAEFIRDEISRDYYKKNIQDKEFYAQILDQLYKNAAGQDAIERDNVSFVLSQNIILFDHVLGFEHPYRMSFLSATEKMLQEKETLANELTSKKLNTDEFKDRLHSTMDKYQAECADFLNDQDFVKLFLITKNDKFSSHIGL